MESMSKKEKLARGSAVIKVMRVVPRPGHYLRSYLDIRKLPKKAAATTAPKGILAEMPWLDVKTADFQFRPKSAKIEPSFFGAWKSDDKDPCAIDSEEDVDPTKIGLPEGHKMLKWFGYREWTKSVCPAHNGNIAEHFNVMLGLLISMAKDPQNQNFPDVEAYPAIQFLRTVKTPTGQIPPNSGRFLSYIEYVCQKLIDEG